MTTSSGSYAVTNSLAAVRAPLMPSSRSCDGPGRFKSGLWDIQHSVSGIVSSFLSQMENREQRRAQLRRPLGDAGACDAPVGSKEQHGVGVGVEPRLEGARAVIVGDRTGALKAWFGGHTGPGR